MLKIGDFKSLEKMLAPLLSHTSILFHLKICSEYVQFCDSDLL